MAKYLLLKHYRGGPAPAVDFDPMDQWAPAEVDAHVQFMSDFATKLEETGEFVEPPGAVHRRARSSATAARAGRRSPTARSRRPRT